MTLVIDLACFLVVSQISVGVCPDSHSLVARSLPINQERPASLRVHLDATTQHPPQHRMKLPRGWSAAVRRCRKTKELKKRCGAKREDGFARFVRACCLPPAKLMTDPRAGNAAYAHVQTRA